MNRLLTFIFLSFFAASILFACKKEYSLETGITTTATGTLDDTTGNCLPDSVYGTFYNGVPAGSDTAYVQVEVNVTAPGTYSIHSDLQNGFEFADSGFFNTTGINIINLKPIGTAILPTATDFTFTFDSTSCMFTVNVQDSTGTGLGGTTGGGGTTGDDTWYFTTPSGTIGGNSTFGAITSASGINLLSIGGLTTSTDSIFSISIQLPDTNVPAAGAQFETTQLNSFFLTNSTGNFLYTAAASNGDVITIIITSYDTSTKELKGTFSGTAQDSSGNNINITNGYFDAVMQ